MKSTTTGKRKMESDNLQTELDPKEIEEIETMYSLAKERGFSWVGDASIECDYADEDLESYCTWEIYLDNPNGGLIGIEIINILNGAWFAYPTDPAPEGFPKFGHYDYEDAVEYALNTINYIEVGLGSSRAGKFSWHGEDVELLVKLCAMDTKVPFVWTTWAPAECLDFSYRPELDAWYGFVADKVKELIPNANDCPWYLHGLFEPIAGGFKCRIDTKNGGFQIV
jgi:hypothetical protein